MGCWQGGLLCPSFWTKLLEEQKGRWCGPRMPQGVAQLGMRQPAGRWQAGQTGGARAQAGPSWKEIGNQADSWPGLEQEPNS